MGIGDFLGKGKFDRGDVIKALSKEKDVSKQRRMEMDLLIPDKLEEVVAMSEVDESLLKQITLIFDDKKLLEKFKKIVKVYIYPKPSVLAESNKWLVKAINRKYKKMKAKSFKGKSCKVEKKKDKKRGRN